MSNGFITLSRQQVEFALGFKWHGHKNLTERAADKLHAELQVRAALADPVPPAGWEPVVYALSRYNDSGGFSPSMVPRESLPEPETREGYVTEEDHRLAMQDNIKLQSELTKARELIQKISDTACGYLPEIKEYLSNQSAPADKGQDDPVTYNSTQVTNCAGCGKYKHTPLRVDGMGGYVCLTCIDERLEKLLYAEQPSSGMAALYQEVTQLRDVVKAVTFWLPKSKHRRDELAATFERMAAMVREAPPETGLD